MFHRVVMDVFDMAGVTGFVAQQVFPIPVLPNRLFAFRCAGGVGLRAQYWIALFGKAGFDEPPARGKIGIARRQCPNAMQMVGQHDDCVQFERAGFAHDAKRGAQNLNRCGSGKNRPPPLPHHSEEAGGSGEKCTSVLHGVCRVTLR